MTDKIRILIVDDHRILTDGIAAMLENNERFEVLGKVLNGVEAMRFLEKKEVDIVLTDLSMPQMDGIELTKQIKNRYPTIKILILSMSFDSLIVLEMNKLGIAGFILKTISQAELNEAVEEVAQGKKYYSREIANRLIEYSEEKAENTLTQRETEILKLIAQELSNAEIAEKLFISERTVETHRKNIYLKTNTKNSIGLVKYAINKNWI